MTESFDAAVSRLVAEVICAVREGKIPWIRARAEMLLARRELLRAIDALDRIAPQTKEVTP
jgi:hypothetical protein